MIKILYLIDQFKHERAGTERQMSRLIQILDRKKFKIHVVVLRESPYLRQLCHTYGICLYEIDRTSSFLNTLFQISKYIKRHQIDILHTFFIDSIFIASFVKLLSPRLLLVTSRRDLGYWYTKPKLAALFFVNFITERILANSESVKKNVIKNEKVSKFKVHVIFNGLDVEMYKKKECSSEALTALKLKFNMRQQEIIFGFVGNLRPVKRPHDFIEALNILNQRFTSWKAVLIGEGGLRGSLMDLIENYGLQEKIHLFGSVSNPSDYYPMINIGVLCSESEGFPNVILEMIAADIPVIGSNVGGISEIIENSGGRLYPVANVKVLADCLLELATNQILSEAIKSKYRDYIQNYEWKNIIYDYEIFYFSLLKLRNEDLKIRSI